MKNWKYWIAAIGLFLLMGIGTADATTYTLHIDIPFYNGPAYGPGSHEMITATLPVTDATCVVTDTGNNDSVRPDSHVQLVTGVDDVWFLDLERAPNVVTAGTDRDGNADVLTVGADASVTVHVYFDGTFSADLDLEFECQPPPTTTTVPPTTTTEPPVTTTEPPTTTSTVPPTSTTTTAPPATSTTTTTTTTTGPPPSTTSTTVPPATTTTTSLPPTTVTSQPPPSTSVPPSTVTEPPVTTVTVVVDPPPVEPPPVLPYTGVGDVLVVLGVAGVLLVLAGLFGVWLAARARKAGGQR